jgi:DNA ligase (NAD+)
LQKNLAKHFKTMDNLEQASYEALLEAPEVGEKIAQSVVEFFKDADNLREVERLGQAGLHV